MRSAVSLARESLSAEGVIREGPAAAEIRIRLLGNVLDWEVPFLFQNDNYPHVAGAPNTS
jgi:hypothetical protein